jgi:hypothetical protein
MKFIERDNRLYTEVDGKELLIKNASKGSDNKFRLIYGWYIYKNPMSMEREYEIVDIDENTCRIV